MLHALFLLIFLASLPAQAEQLYKCIDAGKQVTYSNLPCSKFPGLKEAKTIEVNPAPPAAESKPVTAKETAIAHEPKAKAEKKTAGERAEAKRVLKVERAEKHKCDKLSEQISEVMDKMDAARQAGYTAKQEAEWKRKIRELTARKNRLNCF
ncbi:MAG TPA: DUF4124 domain-containing protein [Thiobacillaceae bacterium]|nr:DUF4124 domain-containing protein [Thiobacillaceae bacterium]